MIRNAAAVLALSLLVAPMTAQAEEAIASLIVHSARCELCPLIVKAILARVKGVEVVEVGSPNPTGDMSATVLFDNAVTTQAALIKATTDHGYPAQAAKVLTQAEIAKMKPITPGGGGG